MGFILRSPPKYVIRASRSENEKSTHLVNISGQIRAWILRLAYGSLRMTALLVTCNLPAKLKSEQL